MLKLNGDPLVLGLVLAVMGMPRAIFNLVGGALTGLAMQYLSRAQLFTGAGAFLLAGALLAFALTPMRAMNDAKSATIPD